MPTSRYTLLIGGLICTMLVLQAPSWFWIYPGPQNESRFFQGYEPLAVVNSSGLGCYADGRPAEKSTSIGGGTSNAAGYSFLMWQKDVEHRRNVEPAYCADAPQSEALFANLRAHALGSLRGARCTVSDDRMSDQNGLRIAYRCDEHSSGVVTIVPPKHDSSGDANYLTLSVQVDERWTPRA
jgi:hypothetical protein